MKEIANNDWKKMFMKDVPKMFVFLLVDCSLELHCSYSLETINDTIKFAIDTTFMNSVHMHLL
jgi:hypothetical protein